MTYFNRSYFAGLLHYAADQNTPTDYGVAIGEVAVGGGTAHVPPEGYDLTGGNGDYMTCDVIMPLPSGQLEHDKQFPGLAAHHDATLVFDIGGSAKGWARPGGVDTLLPLGSGTPPDFVTVLCQSAAPTDLTGYYVSCPVIKIRPGSDSGGQDPDYYYESLGEESLPEYRQNFSPSFGTFEPTDPSHDGDNSALYGWLRRSSVLYTGDPENLASDYLFSPDEIASITWNLVSLVHEADFPWMSFTLYGFWLDEGEVIPPPPPGELTIGPAAGATRRRGRIAGGAADSLRVLSSGSLGEALGGGSVDVHDGAGDVTRD
jgi:hypothetical protein